MIKWPFILLVIFIPLSIFVKPLENFEKWISIQLIKVYINTHIHKKCASLKLIYVYSQRNIKPVEPTAIVCVALD